MLKRLEHVVISEGSFDSKMIGFELRDAGTLAVQVPRGRLRARVVGSTKAAGRRSGLYISRSDEALQAFVVESGNIRPLGVSLVGSRVDLHERNRGIVEPVRLGGSHVAIAGLGSGGSAVLRELVRAGVGRFTLFDDDRLSAGNVSRHELGLADVGRRKVFALRDYILDRNPEAHVRAFPIHIDGEGLVEFLSLLESDRPDVIVCATDSRESRLIVNRVGVYLGIYTLFGAVRHRAFAADVLQVVPGVTPCYQCFLASLPRGTPSPEERASLAGPLPAYSDRPTAVLPGLSIDIQPPALLIAKLALVELMRSGNSRAFDLLAEDLVAPAFFWLSRREPGTMYENWPELTDSSGFDGPRILQWLGRWIERDESCPVCASETSRGALSTMGVFD